MPDMRKVDMREELARMEREVGPVNWSDVIPDGADRGIATNLTQREIDSKWESLFSDLPFLSYVRWLLWLLEWKWLLKHLPKYKEYLLNKVKSTPEYKSREETLWAWAAKKGGWCR